MPTRDLKAAVGSGGGKPKWKKSDKSVQAEMKNKIEASRLRINKKVYDRQQSHTKFMIEKERRQVFNTMKLMRNTSGRSDHSMAPAGPHDCEHEKSAYFQGGAAVDEKRFQRWRVTEKQFQRLMRKEGGQIMHPPWEKDPYADIDDSFADVAKRLGYEQGELDDLLHGKVTQTVEKETLYSSKKLKKPTLQYDKDVFECLRGDYYVDNTPKIRTRAMSAVGPRDQNVFLVRKWEKSVVDKYKELLTTGSLGKVKRPKRTKSASVLLKEHALRMQGMPINDEASENAVNGNKGSDQGADNVDEDDSDDSVHLEDMSISNKARVKKPRPHTAGGGTGSRRGSSQGSLTRGHSANNLTDLSAIKENGLANKPPTKTRSKSALKSRTTATSATTENGFVDPRKGFDAVDLPETRHAVVQSTRSAAKVTFVDESSDGQLNGATENSLVTMPTWQQNGSDVAMEAPAQSQSRRGSTPPTMLQRRGSGRFAPPGESDEDVSDDDDDDDEMGGGHYDKQMFLGRHMRQWKKDLLIEAPPGLNTAKSPIKVALAMSKAQRRRELDRLVDDNISDVKTLVDKEHYRRLQSRVNVFLTVSTVQEAVGKSSSSGTAESVQF